MSFLKKISSSYIITVVSIFLLIILVFVYILFFGSVENLFRLGLENAIFYIIGFIFLGIGITAFLTNLIERPNKKYTKKELYETIKDDYNFLLKDLGDDLYQFLAKQIYSVSEEEFKNNSYLKVLENKLEEIKIKIDFYFTDDFYEINPLHYFPSPDEEFSMVAQEVNIELFMDKIKYDHRENINNFLNKYNSTLPDDLTEKLYALESLIYGSPLFTHFQSLGIKDSLTKLDTDYEKMRNDYRKILEKVIELLSYFEEYEKFTDEDITYYKVNTENK